MYTTYKREDCEREAVVGESLTLLAQERGPEDIIVGWNTGQEFVWIPAGAKVLIGNIQYTVSKLGNLIDTSGPVLLDSFYLKSGKVLTSVQDLTRWF
jgi:hypothetical protein